MSQYSEGSVSVTHNSQQVTGLNTLWLNNITVGSLFKLVGSLDFYQVARVVSNTELFLSENYLQVTQPAASYILIRDFTPNRKYPEVKVGDKDAASIISKALSMIDEDIRFLRNIGLLEVNIGDSITATDIFMFGELWMHDTIYILESLQFFSSGYSTYDSIGITEEVTTEVA